jgi:hypothetical protein
MCFFILSEYAYLEINDPYSTLKTMISRKYSFEKKITQFPLGNNGVDAADTDTDSFLWRDT